jgi:hypothetical protein
MGIISIDVIQLKYKHFITYLSHAKELEDFLTKKGAKVHGFYAVEAGGSDEVVVISHWDSIDARSKAMDEVDEEGMKLHKTVSKCIRAHHNVLAFPNPAFKKSEEAQVKEHTPPKRIRMNCYNVVGNPMEGAKEYVKLFEKIKAKMPGIELKLKGIMHPIAFTGAYNLVTVFDDGSCVDKTMDSFMEFVRDPANADDMKCIYSHFHPIASRMLKRIDADKIAQLKKLAGCQ